jgi:transcriptional regulator with XRE-family HTH domain
LASQGLIRQIVCAHELIEGHPELVPQRHSASQARCATSDTAFKHAACDNLGMGRTNFIREWREANQLSQEALAAAATEMAASFELPEDRASPYSFGRTDVNRYEAGKRDPPIAFLRATAAIFGCAIDDLLSRRPGEARPLPAEIREVVRAWEEVQDADRPRALRALKLFQQGGE